MDHIKKILIVFIAHIDDFEISCLGYFIKYKNEYDEIKIIIASKWLKKEKIWNDNFSLIKKMHHNVSYLNLNFHQRLFQTNFDKIKDAFYKNLPFCKNIRFDLLTHDQNDCHTDHVVISNISKGVFKYTNRYITIYSPSSINFMPNLWIELDKNQFNIKKEMCNKYNINNEQSYSKLGYYLESEDHYNIGRSYMLENFVHIDKKYCEIFRIEKWI